MFHSAQPAVLFNAADGLLRSARAFFSRSRIVIGTIYTHLPAPIFQYGAISFLLGQPAQFPATPMSSLATSGPVWPVFAIILKLLLQPVLRILERLHVPRMLAALLLILALFGTIVGVSTAISGPAGTWAAKLPEGIPRLQERLSFMRAPINTLQQFLQQVEDFGGARASSNAATPAQGPTLLD